MEQAAGQEGSRGPGRIRVLRGRSPSIRPDRDRDPGSPKVQIASLKKVIHHIRLPKCARPLHLFAQCHSAMGPPGYPNLPASPTFSSKTTKL